MDRLSLGARHFLDEESDHAKPIVSILQGIFVAIEWPEDLFAADHYESPFMGEQFQEVLSICV